MPFSHLLAAKTADFSFPSDYATVGGATAIAIRPLAIRLLTPLLDLMRGTPLGIVVTAERS